MNVYGKSAANVEQLEQRLDRGFEKFELQLLGEMISENGILNADDVYDLPALSQYNIYAVHAPLVEAGDINLEYMVRGPKVKLLDQCFYIAEYLAKARFKDMLLIVHTGMDVETLKNLGDNWNDLVVTVGLMLEKYPHVHLCIENVIPIQDVKHHKIRFTNNFRFDNVQMALELRQLLDTDRVGTVLDTCHAMMTKKYIDVLYNEINDKELYPAEDLSLDEFFKQNMDVCKLIHLSGMKGNGMKAPNHGAPFLHTDSKDVAMLQYIMRCYYKYNYNCPLTLEIGEMDVNKPCNYSRTLKTLMQVCNVHIN